jgi:glycosyltransferase involved in cell wall biosynthesis
VVLFAGKLLAFKRPLDVVEASAQARSDGVGVQVIVAGSGELEEAMRARAAALNVPLHLMGFQNQSRMPRAYAAADLLMLPSDGRETWGLVCNEALACGTPILVSTAAGCADDLAADGSAGLSYPCGDIAVAGQALARLLIEPPTPSAIAARSRAYSLSVAADGVMEALVTTISSARPRPSAARPLRSNR